MSIAKLIISIVVSTFPRGNFLSTHRRENYSPLPPMMHPLPTIPKENPPIQFTGHSKLHNREKASPATPVKATFFLITGHLQPNSTLIECLIAQGHEIANHGSPDTPHQSTACRTLLPVSFGSANDILSRLTGQVAAPQVSSRSSLR
jgi:hypothetical protein